MDSRQQFKCSLSDWPYTSDKFNKTLNHTFTWDKHGLQPWLSYTCGISECTRCYTNLQSFPWDVKDKHPRFSDMYLRQFDRDNYRGFTSEEDLNIMSELVRRFEGRDDVIMEEQGTVRERGESFV